MPRDIDFYGEGQSDEAIAIALIKVAGGVPGRSYGNSRSRGKQNVDLRIQGLNAGAQLGRAVLVLRDLDRDATCPGELVSRLLQNRADMLLLRICIPEAEAWLMADLQAYADYAGISLGQMSREPETVDNPKKLLLEMAESGKAPRLARFLKPRRKVGVADWRSLGEWHASFAETKWDPERAAQSANCASLERAIKRLKAIVG